MLRSRAMAEPVTPPNQHGHLLVERRDHVLLLTMNRPEARNALSPEMLVRLARAWHEFRDTNELRVAILTGAGAEDFCAGGDLKRTMPLVTGARQVEDAKIALQHNLGLGGAAVVTMYRLA